MIKIEHKMLYINISKYIYTHTRNVVYVPYPIVLNIYNFFNFSQKTPNIKKDEKLYTGTHVKKILHHTI